MIDLQARLDELRELGLARRPPLVSGPQGPRVVLDGRPVLVLASDNCLGLADHPRVRQAAADAAMRWGVGAGAARVAGGTMTPHRRLEERLRDLHDVEAALVLGCEGAAAAAAVAALAGPGDVVFGDARNRPALADACRLSGAEAVSYDDVAALDAALSAAEGRGALVVTDGVFADDGALAPLRRLAAVARRHGVRLLVDETHALGAVGPAGRGAVAAAGVEADVDAIVGSLGTALGTHGGYVAGPTALVRCLLAGDPALRSATAPSPVTAAGALAALDLLLEQPRRAEKLTANAAALRAALADAGLPVAPEGTHVVALPAVDRRAALRVAALALALGVFVEARDASVRLAVMASHARGELREAAAVLARAFERAGPAAPAPALARAA